MADTTYATHTVWSDPGSFRERLDAFPSEPRGMADMLENFVIHHSAARFLRFGVPDYAESDRELRSSERLLATAFDRDPRPLSQQRDLSAYLYGTCHDFALLAVSAFRSRGVEARLRVGFVDYFRQGRWEDHWLCEYRDTGDWRLLDAQLGRRAREGHGIEFDIADVPRERFRSGSQLWLGIRSGDIDPERCGLFSAGISGDWFPATNVLKDAATLSAIEPLPWDYWGPARDFSLTKSVPVKFHVALKALARAFAEPPSTPAAAKSVLEDFPWAIPGDDIIGSWH